MRKEAGVTLIELLVCLGIMGMLGLGIMGILKGGLDIWGAGKEKANVIAQARVALDRLTRELREATGIIRADPSGINFNAYLQAEGSSASLKDISYYYITGESTLYRNEDGGGGKVIATPVDGFVFSYYDFNMTEFIPVDGTYNDIWMITVTSTVSGAGEGSEVELRSTAQPRNYEDYH